MYICFVDESNTPPKPTQQNCAPYFVVAGVIVHEAQWSAISSELAALKAAPRFRVVGEVKWRYFGPSNADDANGVKHLSQADKDAFRQSMFSIITARNSVKIVYAVCSIAAAYEKPWINTQSDLYFETYKPVSERFQYFLQDMSREVGVKQLGIVVADHQGRKQDQTLREEHQRMVREAGAFTSTYKNYVETIFLTPSHHSVGIQFADMVAGAVARKFNSRDSSFYNMIAGSTRKDHNGRIAGFGAVNVPHSGWR